MVNSNNVIVYPGIIRLENKEMTNTVEPAFGRWETANFLYDIYSKGILKGEVYPSLGISKTCCASCINSFIIGPQGEIYKCWNDVSDKTKVVGYINRKGIVNKELYYRYHIGCEWYNDTECRKCFSYLSAMVSVLGTMNAIYTIMAILTYANVCRKLQGY